MDDSALSLNTGSEAEAIQAHHSFWLFPPDSQDLKRGWEAKSHPGQVACHPVPVTSAQPAPAGATILKEPATSGQPDWLLSHPNKIQRARDSLASPPPYPRKNTDPFHLTNVRRGLGKPQVRVPAPQCPS